MTAESQLGEANVTPSSRRRIAYVFPIYNEEGNIPVLLERVAAATAPLADRYDFEFIFIDDGSRDRSLELLTNARARDPRISIYSFARNYGHQVAVSAGLDKADADAVIVMDSDLQDPPSVSIELIEAWERGVDVAYAQRRSRQDSAFKRATAHAYYWTLSRLSNIEIPRNTGDFRLLDRRVVEEIRRYREHNRFMRGLVAYVGFRQEAVPFDRDARHAGESGYPLKKMLRLAGDGIMGFSTVPLQLISRTGVLLAILAFVWTVYLVIMRVVNPGSVVEGWTFVVAGMFLLGGIQLIMLGVLGSYIGRIYTETQNRPLYAIAHSATGDPQSR